MHASADQYPAGGGPSQWQARRCSRAEQLRGSGPATRLHATEAKFGLRPELRNNLAAKASAPSSSKTASSVSGSMAIRVLSLHSAERYAKCAIHLGLVPKSTMQIEHTELLTQRRMSTRTPCIRAMCTDSACFDPRTLVPSQCGQAHCSAHARCDLVKAQAAGTFTAVSLQALTSALRACAPPSRKKLTIGPTRLHAATQESQKPRPTT